MLQVHSSWTGSAWAGGTPGAAHQPTPLGSLTSSTNPFLDTGRSTLNPACPEFYPAGHTRTGENGVQLPLEGTPLTTRTG
ncbi:unnamed protein product, partial [Amoebophrya sp. A25]|eukprot:GSA25T00009467001.1